MSVGTGLVLLGMWGFAAVCAASPLIPAVTLRVAFFAALIASVAAALL